MEVMEGVFSAWGRILTGYTPTLSIEITRECPLHCPGCYAYGGDHLGGEVTLRELRDFKGQELIDGVLALADRHRPLHISIVGGEPLVRYRELETLLQRHPDAALIRSLPGMGAVLTAELIAEAGSLSRFRSADALASAAGMAPVLRQSGRTRFLRRPNGGNKGLKRVFYQSPFCSLNHDDSRAFYERKRREGKRHHRAVIALARRRVNVLWAVLNSRTPFQTGFKAAP